MIERKMADVVLDFSRRRAPKVRAAVARSCLSLKVRNRPKVRDGRQRDGVVRLGAVEGGWHVTPLEIRTDPRTGWFGMGNLVV